MTRPPNTKNEGKENPTNVRNGKALVNAAVDAIENDRCRTAFIQPQRQAFLLDCRHRSFHDFCLNMSMFTLEFGNRDLWLSRSMADHTGNTLRLHAPPSPQSTAYFSIGPNVAKFYKHELENEESKIGRDETPVAYLLLLEGASSRAIQKFCVSFTAGEAAAIAFRQLANGFSVVFTGVILRESLDKYQNTIKKGRKYAPCANFEDLEKVSSNQNETFPGSGKDVVGVIY